MKKSLKQINNIIPTVYKTIVYSISIILFISINIFNITNQKNNIALTILMAIVLISLLFIINKYIIKKQNKKTNTIITFVLLIVFLLLEIISVIYFRVQYNWDFRYIMESAEQLLNTHTITSENLEYFKVFPNNIATVSIAFLGMLIFKGTIGAYIINIVFVLGAAIFTILCARKIGEEKLGLNAIIIMIMFAPLYLYTPIVYSDTLSVMFPMMTLFFWLLVKENIKVGNNKKAILYTIFMSISGFIGFEIKAVAIIMLIAIFIDATCILKKQFKYVIISLICLTILNFGYNAFCTKYIIKDIKKNDIVYPYTHWIMMGLNKPETEGGTSIGWGAYSMEDGAITGVEQTYEKKVEKNKLVIKDRIANFGIYGYLSFLKHKFIYEWTDSTFYSLKVIGWDTINKSSLLYNIILNSEKNKFFLTYMDAFYIAMLLIILIGLIINIKKDRSQPIRLMYMSCIGIAIFLLFWEARSRYLYFITPVMCLLFAYGIKSLSEINYHEIFKKLKINLRWRQMK